VLGVDEEAERDRGRVRSDRSTPLNAPPLRVTIARLRTGRENRPGLWPGTTEGGPWGTRRDDGTGSPAHGGGHGRWWDGLFGLVASGNLVAAARRTVGGRAAALAGSRRGRAAAVEMAGENHGDWRSCGRGRKVRGHCPRRRSPSGRTVRGG